MEKCEPAVTAKTGPTSAKGRFPFVSFPSGWFCVAYSDELAVGQVLPLHYFGRELVMFRGEDGRACLFDAHCPHLGAHLGFGGVIKDDKIYCPFHGWGFDSAGHCVHVPEADAPPARARLRGWTLRETGGYIFAYYHPQERAPHWKFPWTSDDGDGWHNVGRRQMKIRTHNQEIVENFLDLAHFRHLHKVPLTNVTLEEQGSTLRIVFHTEANAQHEDDAKPSVICHGLGLAITDPRMDPDVELNILATATPIDGEHVDARFDFRMRAAEQMPAGALEEAAQVIVAEVGSQVVRDVMVWGHKAYRTRPLLCPGDGPIMRFRSWARQFYDRSAAKRAD